jgi:hypothetical protein
MANKKKPWQLQARLFHLDPKSKIDAFLRAKNYHTATTALTICIGLA